MEILRQLELHSPQWVIKIRAYIRKIEHRKGSRHEPKGTAPMTPEDITRARKAARYVSGRIPNGPTSGDFRRAAETANRDMLEAIHLLTSPLRESLRQIAAIPPGSQGAYSKFAEAKAIATRTLAEIEAAHGKGWIE